MVLRLLTRLQSLVTIQLIALALLDSVKVVLVLFGLCEFAQQSELSIQVSGFHAVLELRKGHTLFNLGHIFVLGYPLVRQVLRGLWSFNNNVWLPTSAAPALLWGLLCCTAIILLLCR